ncbi:MAG TPA: 50S ribosomal protein L40e [archaeon]|nr:50S ribosomal protein L40e [archaeon]
MVMAAVAQKRLFQNVWICMRCNAKNRAQTGKMPSKCRKCNSKKLRLRKKGKKKAA